jgi:predicted DNA-binding transcriptional regulator AlpA
MASRERLLKIGEVADWIGTSENTLRFWRTQGIGPKSAKLGRRIAYRESDVQEWLDAQFEDAS